MLRSPGVPLYAEFDPPGSVPGHTVVRVAAAGLNPLDIARAAGRIPELREPYPVVAGHEGVGTVGGRRVYFGATRSPYGSMAELALVPDNALIALDATLPDPVAVALGTSGVAAWLALSSRAALRPGETVLVLGATGVVGSLAVQLARLLGAGRVVAAGRDAGALARSLDLGADAAVDLTATEGLSAAFRAAARGRVDVVVDLVWGRAAVAALGACRPGARHVQVGQAASPTAALGSGPFRGSGADLLGFSIAHSPATERAAAYAAVLDHAVAGRLLVESESVPLADLGYAWHRVSRSAHRKVVLVP